MQDLLRKSIELVPEELKSREACLDYLGKRMQARMRECSNTCARTFLIISSA